MSSDRRTALIAGVLFLLTFVTAIVGLSLYDSVLNDSRFILGGDGNDTAIAFGALLEIFLAITNIGTAVVLFPILKRQSETISLAYVASRILESTIIVVGLISVLAVVTLRQDFEGGPGAHPASWALAAKSLVAIHDWTFLLGPGFCSAFTGILLGYLFYRSGLVPRGMAMVGLVGGPLAFLAATYALFGFEQGTPVQLVLTLPEIVWELLLGLYLTFKGFKPAPILFQDPDPTVPVALA